MRKTAFRGRVPHIIMPLVWFALIGVTRPIRVLLYCLQTMRFYQILGHGNSSTFTGGDRFYFMGLGQSSGGAPPSWVCLSSVIVYILRKLRHGARMLDPDCVCDPHTLSLSRTRSKFQREEPTGQDWEVWRNFWHQHMVENFQLHTPLGAWTSTTHRRREWFYDEADDCLQRKVGLEIEYYILHKWQDQYKIQGNLRETLFKVWRAQEQANISPRCSRDWC